MFCCMSAPVVVYKDDSTSSTSRQTAGLNNSVGSMDGDGDGSGNGEDGTREWRIFNTVEASMEHYSTMPYAPKKLTVHQIEMLTVLELDCCSSLLATYAASTNTQLIFLCWKDMGALTARLLSETFSKKCFEIFRKYVEDVPADYFSADTASREDCIAYFTAKRASGCNINQQDAIPYLQWLHRGCFLTFFERIYLNFRKSAKYILMYKLLRERYNRLNSNDFEYLCSLGHGAYGVVLSCRRKSTGRTYAMKLQRKHVQFEQFESEPWRVEDEKKVHAAFNNPYIVELSYAMQTRSLTMLVLDIAAFGDLRTIMEKLPTKCLSHQQILVYGAELVSALCYMHERGVLYRDMKPGNVLLCDDGHVKLTDLGSINDTGGTVTGVFEEADNLLPVFRPSGSAEVKRLSAKYNKQMNLHARSEPVIPVASQEPATAHSSTIPAEGHITPTNITSPTGGANIADKRFPTESAGGDAVHSSRGSAGDPYRMVVQCTKGIDLLPVAPLGASYASFELRPRVKTLVGTMGYMAPEVMMLYSVLGDVDGYTFSCDWWSLGATLFKMYTGLRPYAYKRPKKGGCESNAGSHVGGASVSIVDGITRQTSSSISTDCGMSASVDDEEEEDNHVLYRYRNTKRLLYDPIVFSVEAEDFIRKLLTMDPAARLGSGPDPYGEITEHPYFTPIDFRLIELKRFPAAPLPVKNGRKGIFGSRGAAKEIPKTLEEIMTSLGHASWMHDSCSTVSGYFEHWDYIAPHMIAEEVRQHNLC